MAEAIAVAEATTATQKKRPRLNPARRKTAKAKEQSQTVPAVSVAKTGGDVAVAAKEPPATVNTKPNFPAAPGRKQNTSISRASAKTGKVTSTIPPPKPSQKPTKQDAASPPSARGTKSNALVTGPAFVTGGLLGCAAGAAVLLGSGLLKHAVGVDSAVLAARSAKAVLNNLIDEMIASMKAGTYSSVDALDMLRRTTLAYATTIPGGAPLVEQIFREVEMVRKQRGHEIDKVVADATAELSGASKKGAGPAELQSIILRNLIKLSRFAGAATQDVVVRNPRLSPYRDSAARALQPPPPSKTPTVKLNMSIKHKKLAAA